MDTTHYQVIVVGGGILGAAIFRDLSLHGISCLLLEQGDFASQTSSRSSKMLHGGIRYLPMLDFELIAESLKEKKLLLQAVPHLTAEIPFVYPLYQDLKLSPWMLKLGLKAYDFLAGKNENHSHMLDPKSCLQHVPGIKMQGLLGAGLYTDGLVDDIRLTVDQIFDTIDTCPGQSDALNYHQVTSVDLNSHKKTVTVFDLIQKKQKKFSGQFLVLATGPFTCQLFKQLKFNHFENRHLILPSKGTHLWVKKDRLQIKNALVLQTADNRIIFALPFAHACLLGTTEILTDENIFNIGPLDSEISYIKENFKHYFPTHTIASEDILASFSGVRPLVIQGQHQNKDIDILSPGSISRKHSIIQIDSSSFALMGGKYTNFRICAQDITKKIMQRLNIAHDPYKILSPFKKKRPSLLFSSLNASFVEIEDIIQNQKVRNFEDLWKRRLSIPDLKFLNYLVQDHMHELWAPYQKTLTAYFKSDMQGLLKL